MMDVHSGSSQEEFGRPGARFECGKCMIDYSSLIITPLLLVQIMLLQYILLTQLRDMKPAIRKGLEKFIGALRRLDGQVHSYNHATNNLGILPGSRTIDKRELQDIHNDLICGLSLLEGCLPPSHLNPGLHHFVHYAAYTLTHGCLRSYWMMCFERCVILFQLTCNHWPICLVQVQ